MSSPHSKETISELKLMGVDQKNFWRQLFCTLGTGAGTTDMSAAADQYFIFPPDGDIYVVEKIKIIVEDGGNFPNDEFGGLGAALTNGILFREVQGSVTSQDNFSDILGGLTLKQNSDFTMLGEVTYSIDVTGLSVLVCEIDFTKEFGFPMVLNGSNDFGLMFETQDDMSALTRMYVIASGISQDARVL